jgi:hypothetical protein
VPILRDDPHLVRKISISLAIGLAISLCGALPYYRPDLAVGGGIDVLIKVLAAMFMAGLLVAALLGGNVHDASLGFAVFVNCLLYGLGVFMILKRRKG